MPANDPYALHLSCFGALPDMRQSVAASISAGSLTLTVADAEFTSADLGKTIVVGTGGASRHLATIDAIITESEVTMSAAPSVSLDPTGLTWGTDCTAALQSAIDDLGEKGGGRLIVDGRYLLAGSVSKDLLNIADHIEILGYGGVSTFAISGSASSASLAIQNAARLTISNVNFVGTPNLSHDVARVLDIQHSNVAIRDCAFWGLAAAYAENAIVWTYECDLEMTDCRFGGCVTASANNTSTVECLLWRRLNFTRCRWVDYGQFDGILHSKTGFFVPLGWVHVGNTSGPDIDALGQGVARIIDCRGDEGALAGLFIDPGKGNYLSRVLIDGWEGNVHGSASGRGIHIANVINAEIRRSAFGYVATPADAIRLNSCTTVLVDQCEGSDGATRLTANIIGHLTVKDSPRISTRVLSAIGRYDQGITIRRLLPNIAGGGIAAGGYYDFVLPSADYTIATVLVSIAGRGEGNSADRYKVSHEVRDRSATSAVLRVYNLGASGQTIDVELEVSY
jgi:hypothetical protein